MVYVEFSVLKDAFDFKLWRHIYYVSSQEPHEDKMNSSQKNMLNPTKTFKAYLDVSLAIIEGRAFTWESGKHVNLRAAM